MPKYDFSNILLMIICLESIGHTPNRAPGVHLAELDCQYSMSRGDIDKAVRCTCTTGRGLTDLFACATSYLKGRSD